MVFPEEEFYIIPWDYWAWFFDGKYTKIALNMIKRSSVIHVWNALSHNATIKKSDPETVYGAMAKKHCKHSYAASGEYF